MHNLDTTYKPICEYFQDYIAKCIELKPINNQVQLEEYERYWYFSIICIYISFIFQVSAYAVLSVKSQCKDTMKIQKAPGLD